jgi:hypothetical protein
MTFMPQTLSSDAPRPGCRTENFALLRGAIIPERAPSSIIAQILSRLFPGRSAARGRLGAVQVEASSDLFSFYRDRGIALYELGHYHTAAANFRMALRLNWRDEQTTAWIARAEDACRGHEKPPRFNVIAVSS